jgi:hypothetical protein
MDIYSARQKYPINSVNSKVYNGKIDLILCRHGAKVLVQNLPISSSLHCHNHDFQHMMSTHKDGVTRDAIDAKEFSAAFASARAVTEESDRESNVIARYGPASIYSLLQRVFPQVDSDSDYALESSFTPLVHFLLMTDFAAEYLTGSFQVCAEPGTPPTRSKTTCNEFNKILASECGFKSKVIRRKAFARCAFMLQAEFIEQ